MTVAAVVYYIGAGVFNYDGVDFKYGEELPGNVPAATIKSMREKGKVSDTPPANEKASSNELGALRDKVRELTTQLVAATGERDHARDAAEAAGAAAIRNCDEITRLQGEISSVRDQLAAVTGERDRAQATISEMTKAQLNSAPAAPAEAGPAKK